jgi:hypothetical protein
MGAFYPYGHIPSIDAPSLQLALDKVLSWSVPVHRHGCPSEIAVKIGTASSRLNSLLLSPTDELKKLANTTFYRGNLPLNVWTRYLLSQRCLNECDETIELVNAAISNAGSVISERAGPLLDSYIMPHILNGLPDQKFRLLLALGSE